MPYAARYIKHPLETLDYDEDFGSFLKAKDDSIKSFFVESDTGLNIVSTAFVGNSKVRAFFAGGVSGKSYRIAATAITNGGRTKRIESLVRVRGVGVLPAPASTHRYIDGGNASSTYGNGVIVDGGNATSDFTGSTVFNAGSA